MKHHSLEKLVVGYRAFRTKYAQGDQSVMRQLAHHGQKPKTMVIACCDSRVDPALILQCDPGDLFVVRNVANIVPPYEHDEAHHGTSAALEFGVRVLGVRHLILLGHSQCGGIQSLLQQQHTPYDFIHTWMSLVDKADQCIQDTDAYAKAALKQSYNHCMTFPWILHRVREGKLTIQKWFFHIETGCIAYYDNTQDTYRMLDQDV